MNPVRLSKRDSHKVRSARVSKPAGISEALEVQLPVCPVESCRRVGKIPIGHYGGKEFCSGPMGQSHRKVRMKKATFRMVEDRGETKAAA